MLIVLCQILFQKAESPKKKPDKKIATVEIDPMSQLFQEIIELGVRADEVTKEVIAAKKSLKKVKKSEENAEVDAAEETLRIAQESEEEKRAELRKYEESLLEQSKFDSIIGYIEVTNEADRRKRLVSFITSIEALKSVTLANKLLSNLVESEFEREHKDIQLASTYTELIRVFPQDSETWRNASSIVLKDLLERLSQDHTQFSKRMLTIVLVDILTLSNRKEANKILSKKCNFDIVGHRLGSQYENIAELYALLLRKNGVNITGSRIKKPWPLLYAALAHYSGR
jgi:hypothetical protein